MKYIQNYFSGVERHAGTLINYAFPGGRGQFRSFTTPLSQNPRPSPVGGGGVYIDWCIIYDNKLEYLLQATRRYEMNIVINVLMYSSPKQVLWLCMGEQSFHCVIYICAIIDL